LAFSSKFYSKFYQEAEVAFRRQLKERLLEPDPAEAARRVHAIRAELEKQLGQRGFDRFRDTFVTGSTDGTILCQDWLNFDAGDECEIELNISVYRVHKTTPAFTMIRVAHVSRGGLSVTSEVMKEEVDEYAFWDAEVDVTAFVNRFTALFSEDILPSNDKRSMKKAGLAEKNDAAFKRQLKERKLVPAADEAEAYIKNIFDELKRLMTTDGYTEFKSEIRKLGGNETLCIVATGYISGLSKNGLRVNVRSDVNRGYNDAPAYSITRLYGVRDEVNKTSHDLLRAVHAVAVSKFWDNELDVPEFYAAVRSVIRELSAEVEKDNKNKKTASLTNEQAFKRQLSERNLVPEKDEVVARLGKMTDELKRLMTTNGYTNVRGGITSIPNALVEVAGGWVNGIDYDGFEVRCATHVNKYTHQQPAYTVLFLDAVWPNLDNVLSKEQHKKSIVSKWWDDEIDVADFFKKAQNIVDEIKRDRKREASVDVFETRDDAFKRQLKDRLLMPDKDEAEKMIDDVIAKLSHWLKQQERFSFVKIESAPSAVPAVMMRKRVVASIRTLHILFDVSVLRSIGTTQPAMTLVRFVGARLDGQLIQINSDFASERAYWDKEVDIHTFYANAQTNIDEARRKAGKEYVKFSDHVLNASRVAALLVAEKETKEEAFKRQLKNRLLDPSKEEAGKRTDEIAEEISGWLKNKGFDRVMIDKIEPAPAFSGVSRRWIRGYNKDGLGVAFHATVYKVKDRTPARTNVFWHSAKLYDNDMNIIRNLQVRSCPAEETAYWDEEIDMRKFFSDVDRNIREVRDVFVDVKVEKEKNVWASNLLTAAEGNVLEKWEEDRVIRDGGITVTITLDEEIGDDVVVSGCFFGKRPERGYSLLPAPEKNIKDYAERLARNTDDREMPHSREYFVDVTAMRFMPFIKQRVAHDKEGIGLLFDEAVKRLDSGDFEVNVRTNEFRGLEFKMKIKDWKRFFDRDEKTKVAGDETGYFEESDSDAFKRQMKERILKPDENEVNREMNKIDAEIESWLKKRGFSDVDVKRSKFDTHEQQSLRFADEITARQDKSWITVFVNFYENQRTDAVRMVIFLFTAGVRDSVVALKRNSVVEDAYWDKLPDVKEFIRKSDIATSGVFGSIIEDGRFSLFENNKTAAVKRVAFALFASRKEDAFKKQLTERKLKPELEEAKAYLKNIETQCERYLRSKGFTEIQTIRDTPRLPEDTMIAFSEVSVKNDDRTSPSFMIYVDGGFDTKPASARIYLNNWSGKKRILVDVDTEPFQNAWWDDEINMSNFFKKVDKAWEKTT